MKKLVALTAAVALTAGPALAHPGHGLASGFGAGVIHPLTGGDHLLAMLAVGLWSGFALPRYFWVGAATFLAAMAAGAGLSWAGVAIPMVETWITLSVVVFGLLTLAARDGQGRGLTVASLLAIAGFATCHGYAHASEATGAALGYLAGFLAATAALHFVGIALARTVATGRAARLVQAILGAAIAVGGLAMIGG